MAHQMTYDEWLVRNPDAVKVDCTDCNGIGFFDCGECDGQGVKTCPACKGKAKGCEACKGTGGAFCENCEDGELVCQDCDGWGNLSYVTYRDQLRLERELLAAWTAPTEARDAD